MKPEITIDWAALAANPPFVLDTVEWQIEMTPEDWREWMPRPRIASRQSCLWRHSFDWRNRKRGHPIHR
jgi:hypothetical protein